MFLWWSYTKVDWAGWLVKITKPPVGEAHFLIYLHRKLWNSSCQKPLDWTQLTEMFLWWPCTKIVQVVMIRQEKWPSGGGRGGLGMWGYSTLYIYIYMKFFFKFLIRNHWADFSIIWQKGSFGCHVPKWFKPSWFIRKNGHQGCLTSPIYLYGKLQKLSCQKPLDRFL